MKAQSTKLPYLKRDSEALLLDRVKHEESLRSFGFPLPPPPPNQSRARSPPLSSSSSTAESSDTPAISLLNMAQKFFNFKWGDWWHDWVSISDSNSSLEVSHERHMRHARFRAEFPLKLGGAIFTGASLVGPMLIMAIHPSHEKTLITASVSIFVFGLLATLTPANPSEVVAVVAAYAAVMVVFVGLAIT
jgi:hypothetical protein